MRSSYGSYRMLIAAAVLGPALLVMAMAWWSWGRADREARLDVTRITDLLHEQAERVIDADELVLAQINDTVAGRAWTDIAAHQAQVQELLARMTERVGGISGAFLVDDQGVVRVLTLRDPALVLMAPLPGAVVRDQPYFEATRGRRTSVLDGPFVVPSTDRAVLRLARRLSAPDGSFQGVAVLWLAPRSLIEFWKSVVAAPGDAVSLAREDGTVLARFPEINMRGRGGVPPRYSAPLAARMEGSEAGLLDTVSAVDGIDRISGYRKLSDYPVYIVYGVDKRNVLRDWYPSLAAFTALGVAAAGALLLAALVVIRRARGEAEALDRAERTALALRESEAMQRALFRNAPVPMHALDRNWRIIDVNGRWLELFQCTRDEVAGRSITEFQEDDGSGRRQGRWLELLPPGELKDVHLRFLKKSGEAVEAFVSTTVERDDKGEFVRAISIVIDVTERLHAEEAVRREQQLSQLLAESSTDGIVGVDTDFRFTVWNRAMEAMSDVPRGAVLGQGVFDLRPDLAGTPAEAALGAALQGQKTSLHNRELTFPRTGRGGRYDVDFAPLYAPDRSVIGALVFLRDVTERQRIEQQLRQAQKMEAVGQLTGGIAHDFNNLLTVVLGNIDVLRQRLTEGDLRRNDREMEKAAGAVARAAERGALLTQRLLAFSRRQALEPTPVDPNKLLAGIADLLRRTLGEGIAIETILAGGIWRTLADPTELENAILNLALNARDAMPSGGKLTVETENAYLDEDYARIHEDVSVGQYVLIAVSDTGFGMSKEVAEKAFEPFFTTKGVGQGTGLGLSQVYGFVKQSGGHVKIYTEPGKGTTVKIHLPRLVSTEVAAHEVASEPEASAPRAHGETILVVEDDEDVRAYSAGVLQELGYRVLTAADGATALRLVESEPDVKLMFTDIGLPGGLNGREVAEAAWRIRPSLNVLFTTGYARTTIVHHGRLDPGVELLGKPFSSPALAARIRQLLSRQEETRII
jgi:PAS domain S-box-containing protein